MNTRLQLITRHPKVENTIQTNLLTVKLKRMNIIVIVA